MDDAIKRAARLWDSGACGVAKSSEGQRSVSGNEWQASDKHAIYELQNYKQTWRAYSEAQKDLSIAYCYKLWDSRH